MFDFQYLIKFFIAEQKLNIQIYLNLDQLYTPVYLGTYDADVLNYREAFMVIYQEISDYLKETKIRISNDDLRLLYSSLTNFDLPLPTLEAIFVNQVQVPHLGSLTPKEKLFLALAHGTPVDSKFNQGFYREYALDPAYLIASLEKRGYITTKDTLFNLNQASLVELHEILRQHKLDTSGTKEEMRQRLQTTLKPEELAKCFAGMYIKLSPATESYLKQYQKLVAFHKHQTRTEQQLRIDEFYLLSLQKPELSVDEICKLLLLNQNKHQLQTFDWKQLFAQTNQASEYDQGLEQVANQDDLATLLSKYVAKDEGMEIPQVDAVSDEEFLALINKKTNEKNPDMVNPIVEQIKKIKHSHLNYIIFFCLRVVLTLGLTVLTLYFIYRKLI